VWRIGRLGVYCQDGGAGKPKKKAKNTKQKSQKKYKTKKTKKRMGQGGLQILLLRWYGSYLGGYRAECMVWSMVGKWGVYTDADGLLCKYYYYYVYAYHTNPGSHPQRPRADCTLPLLLTRAATSTARVSSRNPRSGSQLAQGTDSPLLSTVNHSRQATTQHDRSYWPR
jgi:hypothetical protein